MAIKEIEDGAAFLHEIRHSKDLAIIGFFGNFSEAAQRTQEIFKELVEKHDHLTYFSVDVQKVKNVHKELDVTNVPTVLMLRNNEIIQRIVGEQPLSYYEKALFCTPEAYSSGSTDSKPKQPRVTVYSTPTCSWCTRLKSYLRTHGIIFNDIDVSQDESAAQSMRARSGQMGVPQTDINGTMIVGFDQSKINQLLGIQG